MGKRMKEHVASPSTTPLLIFPEGTCVNNEYCVMFKRGAFDLNAARCRLCAGRLQLSQPELARRLRRWCALWPSNTTRSSWMPFGIPSASPSLPTWCTLSWFAARSIGAALTPCRRCADQADDQLGRGVRRLLPGAPGDGWPLALLPSCPKLSVALWAQVQKHGESSQQFAERVQAMIAKRAGLKVVPWDGYLKYYNLAAKVGPGNASARCCLLLGLTRCACSTLTSWRRGRTCWPPRSGVSWAKSRMALEDTKVWPG